MGIAHDFGTAQYKAFLSTIRGFPADPTALCAIAEAEMEESLVMLRALHGLGFRMFATEETAGALRDAGLSTLLVGQYPNGHPNPVDLIRSGAVDLVLDIVPRTRSRSNGAATPLKDGYGIRRASVERHVPCLTSLDTVRALVETLLGQAQASEWIALSLTEYVPDGLLLPVAT
jgi:carbamoyl-phosphate synthase large subunit